VSALLNFAPTTVSAPAHVTVRRVDIATELHVLAFHREQQRLAQLGVAGVAG
jgi:redox-sensing transcriptional repressor